jgi:hypothetical protein
MPVEKMWLALYKKLLKSVLKILLKWQVMKFRLTKKVNYFNNCYEILIIVTNP